MKQELYLITATLSLFGLVVGSFVGTVVLIGSLL